MYPDYQIHSTSVPEPGQLEHILTDLEDAGCTLPEHVADAWHTARQNYQHVDETEAGLYDQARIVDDVAAKLAQGSGTVQDVERALIVQSLTTKDLDSALKRQDAIFNAARRQIDRDLRNAMNGHGEAWITETMRPVVTELVEQLRAADIETFGIYRDGLMDQLEPVVAQEHVGNAWWRLLKIYDAAQELRRLRVIPSTMERQDLYEYAGDPTERDSLRRTFTVWTYLARRGHKPGIYTQAEAEQHMADHGVVNLNLPAARAQGYEEARRQAEFFRPQK